jgi:putative ABC transport system permease protein
MRLSDILWLSLSALAQQRQRTLLSTLGVFFASFVLVMSLSMGRGVQEAIAHEYSRFAGLRQIDVLKTYESSGDEEKIEVKGVMSEPRRLRLRHEIQRHQAQDPRRIAGTRLTPRMLPLLSEIPHVASVTADVGFYPRAILDNHIEEAFVHSSPPDRKQLLGRIVAGRYLNVQDADSAVVTEYLLFRLGIVDETAIQAALGRKLRLEYQADGTTIGREVAIVGVLRSASKDDVRNHYLDGWTENVVSSCRCAPPRTCSSKRPATASWDSVA